MLQNSRVSWDDALNILCQLLTQQAAPDAAIDTFDGNPLNYFYFMVLFKKAIKKKIYDPKGRLTSLIKFIRGEAKELIQPCIQLPNPNGCKKVISLIERSYGNLHAIIAACRREIKKWYSSNLRIQLTCFYSFLIKCQSITDDIT